MSSSACVFVCVVLFTCTLVFVHYIFDCMSSVTSYNVMIREKLITLSTIETLEIENSQLNNKVSLLL